MPGVDGKHEVETTSPSTAADLNDNGGQKRGSVYSTKSAVSTTSEDGVNNETAKEDSHNEVYRVSSSHYFSPSVLPSLLPFSIRPNLGFFHAPYSWFSSIELLLLRSWCSPILCTDFYFLNLFALLFLMPLRPLPHLYTISSQPPKFS